VRQTRLGLQVAAGLLDGSGDGVWVAELAPVTDQDAVPAAISRALRLTGQPGRPALEALLDALALQDVLIVVDNCEHLIGGCAKTAEAILRRCPRVHLLATSREPLGIGGESIYRVPSLSLPGPDDSDSGTPGSSDAVALFADRARASGVALAVDEEAGPLAVSVCRRLDGMPLAIELAAARLRSMSLAELHSRLDQRFRLLTGGSRTALERQQTLAATVGWSYSLLTGAEQVLLGRLSVFAGGFGLAAAEAVCGSGRLDVLDVADLLGSLVDKSLVVAEPAGGTLRYRLLETIRLFAAERLAEAGEEEAAAAAAHCGHFLAAAEAAAAYLTGPEQGSWLTRLDADQANLRRAAGHAVGRPDGTAVVLRLGVALDRYWRARSREQEAFELLVPALRRPDAAADPALFAAALVTAAHAALFIDLPTARPLAEQAVQVARQLGDDRLLSSALAALCDTHFFAGEPETGRPFGQESVERARQLGDDVLLAQGLRGYLPTVDPARAGPGRYTPCRSPAPNDPATISATPSCTTTPAFMPWRPGTSPPPELTWKPPRKPRSRSDGRTAPCRWCWGCCCAWREISTAPGLRGRPPCGSAAGTATPGSWPSPSSAWPSWPAMRATGTGQPCCTAPRRPSLTGPAIRGKNPMRVTAWTAWTKRVRTWAMSSWSGPTRRAWRSASTKPSTWLSRKRARPDRCRRKPEGHH
jgi:predicted ATPase